MTKLVASCFGVACILVFYFVNVNRTAFYILAILLLCSFSLFHKLSFSQLIKVMPKWAIAALLVTALVIPSYVVFIATARSSGEGENAQIVSDNIKLRYHLQTLEQIDYNTACGVYKVHWYTTHPIANLFSYIDTNAPLTYFDGRGTFFYPISQYNKIFPSDQIDYQESWNRQISDIESAGIPVWQWCTGYATIINDFGIFGCLIFVFILSTILSAATRSFLLTHDWLAGLTALWISILLIVLWTNFPIDTFFQLSIYTTILALGIRFIITRRCFL